jgi:hypothetical protein
MDENDAVPPLATRFRTGFREGLTISLKLLKIVVPLYIVVDLVKTTPFAAALGKAFAPMMHLFGLPGEAALAFMAAFLLNLYAAIAILAPLHLSAWQVTQCGLMMGIAHNLLVEGGVLGSTGARGGLLTLCRLGMAASVGLGLEVLRRLVGG